MRIVQTFWSAGKSPLKESFGWRHPEYNLMSWALSCLSLREHYDEVVLYTDSIGKEILIDTLHLPYTDVHVVFDDFDCLPQHWALAKIMTYSMQTDPFLHVDGDVYLSQPIDPIVLASPLIAQNREIGTGYYRYMMDRILSYPEIDIPVYIRKGLKEESIGSYNMGLFGGSDLEFIHRYCQEVFSFMERNNMNDPRCRQSVVDCNVFFEQVVFAVLADSTLRKVSNVIGHDMCDQGYTVDEFCNLYSFRDRPLHHLLGGHKRNPRVLNMLRSTVANMYPMVYKQILELFFKAKSSVDIPILFTGNTLIDDLLGFANNCVCKWKKLSASECIAYEREKIRNATFLASSEQQRALFGLRLSDYVCLYDLPEDCKGEDLQSLRAHFSFEKHFPLKHFAVIPTFVGEGYEIVPLLREDVDIIKLLQSAECSMDMLVDVQKDEKAVPKKNQSHSGEYLTHEIEYLIKKDIIFVTNLKSEET